MSRPNEPLDGERVLVVHVQRTGGTSLRRAIETQHGEASVHPSTRLIEARPDGRYVTPSEILDTFGSLPPYHFLFGHFLASLGDLLPVPHARAVFLRDPIERSISIVQLHSQTTGRAVSDLVGDAGFLESHIIDMQTRVLGTDPEFGHRRPQECPLATDVTLENAIERMRSFEFVGTTETYESSVKRFDSVFGTRLSDSIGRVNSSRPGDVDRRELAEVFRPLVERDITLHRACCSHIGAVT